MRRAGTVLAVLIGLAFATVLVGANGDGGQGTEYELEFDNAFGIVEGGDFKIAGVRAGTTTGFSLTEGPRAKAIVDVEVTEPGFDDLRADARCSIRPQSLIGEYFVDCVPGTSGRRIPDGGRLPARQTSSTIPIDLVNNILREPYRARLRLIIEELGTGLAGRPEDLNAVLRRAHPGLRETTQTLRILARQTRTIERLIVDGDAVVAALARRKSDVSRFVREAGETAAITATRREDLRASFARFPGFLAELEPYMARLGRLASVQVPLLRDLRSAADELDVFLTRLRPFAAAGRPALISLGRASRTGSAAVRETREEVDELRRLVSAAPGLAEPLRQLLQTLDDRARAVEDDPRAAATSPPAGDKTHIPPGGSGGFTGMEAIWNYFFWQTLSTNAMDDVGHVLRLTTLVSGCSEYQVRREGHETLFDDCNQWLGPHQPGITAPDPTEATGSATASAPRPARAPVSPAPAAEPAPSAPSPAPGPDRPAPGSEAPAETLLDFLLAP